MPYSSTKDLNPATKKAHPSGKGRRVFLAVFNAVSKKGAGEASAFKQAHAAADRAEGKRPAHPVKRGKVGKPPQKKHTARRARGK